MRLPWMLMLQAVGQLLLRLAVVAPLLAPALAAGGVHGVLLWADIALLLAGLLTPAAALAATLHALGHDAPAHALAALALALVGAGRWSLDAWLFGPRLIAAWPRGPG